MAATISAFLWLLAARVPLPPARADAGEDGADGGVSQASIVDALKHQSIMNARAAIIAAFAAASEAGALLIHALGLSH